MDNHLLLLRYYQGVTITRNTGRPSQHTLAVKPELAKSHHDQRPRVRRRPRTPQDPSLSRPTPGRAVTAPAATVTHATTAEAAATAEASRKRVTIASSPPTSPSRGLVSPLAPGSPGARGSAPAAPPSTINWRSGGAFAAGGPRAGRPRIPPPVTADYGNLWNQAADLELWSKKKEREAQERSRTILSSSEAKVRLLRLHRVR